MNVVASQQLGQLQRSESAPAVFAWRWYYHVPSVPVWILVGLSIVVFKENRCWQALLILVPLLVVMLVWRMLTRLLSMPPEVAELTSGFVFSIMAAWAILWLLGHRVSRTQGVVRLFTAMAVMLAVGTLSCHSFFGLGSTDGWPLWFMLFSICTLALLLGATLSGYFCRKKFSPRRFMAWLLLWTGLAVPIACAPVLAASIAFVESSNPVEFLTILLDALMASLMACPFLGGALYLTNAPFMFMAHRSAFYNERFYRALGVPERARVGESPFASEIQIEAA